MAETDEKDKKGQEGAGEGSDGQQKDKEKDADKITITKEELQKQIDEAAKKAASETAQIEKDKLYKTLEVRAQEIESYKSELAKFKEKDAEVAKQKEAERVAALSEQERIKETIQRQAEEVEKVKMAFGQLQKETETKIRNKDLELYREKLILSANGEVIPELVAGNTEAEIAASLDRAKVRYKEIAMKVGGGSVDQGGTGDKLKDMNRKSVSTEVPIEKGMQQSAGDGASLKSAEEIMAMDKATFARYKEQVLKEAGV